MRDPGFCVHGSEVENRHPGRLASCPRGGRHGDQRFERSRNRQPPANRGVHIIQKIIRRIRGIEVRRLGRVHGRAAPRGDEPVEGILLREKNGLLE